MTLSESIWAVAHLPARARARVAIFLIGTLPQPKPAKPRLRVCTAVGRLLGTLEVPAAVQDVLQLAQEHDLDNPQVLKPGSWTAVVGIVVPEQLHEVAVVPFPDIDTSFNIRRINCGWRTETRTASGPGANEVTIVTKLKDQRYIITVVDVACRQRSSWTFTSCSRIRRIRTCRRTRLVAVQNADTARIWEVQRSTGHLISRVREDSLQDCEFSGCGRYFYTSSAGRVFLTDLKTQDTRLVVNVPRRFYFAGQHPTNGVYGFTAGECWVAVDTQGTKRRLHTLENNAAFWSARTVDDTAIFVVCPGAEKAVFARWSRDLRFRITTFTQDHVFDWPGSHLIVDIHAGTGDVFTREDTLDGVVYARNTHVKRSQYSHGHLAAITGNGRVFVTFHYARRDGQAEDFFHRHTLRPNCIAVTAKTWK